MAGKVRRRHGLGAQGVTTLIASQGGVCAICGVPNEDRPGYRLALDHDHRHCEGRIGCPTCIRGAICNADNNLLRLSGDSPERLRAAADYLERTHREYPARARKAG